VSLTRAKRTARATGCDPFTALGPRAVTGHDPSRCKIRNHRCAYHSGTPWALMWDLRASPDPLHSRKRPSQHSRCCVRHAAFAISRISKGSHAASQQLINLSGGLRDLDRLCPIQAFA
jgi:hypothetical protein